MHENAIAARNTKTSPNMLRGVFGFQANINSYIDANEKCGSSESNTEFWCEAAHFMSLFDPEKVSAVLTRTNNPLAESECLHELRVHHIDTKKVFNFFASVASAFKGRKGEGRQVDGRREHGVGLLNELQVS
jgi:hypothetical protein